MALIDGLISYWKLDEISGVDVSDSHGVNDGTTHNMEDGDWVAGKINNALDFGGTDEYVDVGTMGNFGSDLGDSVSVSFWIKTTSGGRERVFGTINDGATIVLEVGINEKYDGTTDVGKVFFSLRDEDGNSLRFGSTNDINFRDGAWHHLVFTADGDTNTGVIYLDNVSMAITYQTQTTPDNWVNFDYPMYLGASNIRGVLSFPIVGTLDEIGMWNKILGVAEVSELWNDGDGLAYPFVVGTNMKINIGGVLKDIESLKINIGGVLKDVVQVKQNIGGVLKDVFG